MCEVVWGWDAIAFMQAQAERFTKRADVWALAARAADERLHPWERLDRVLMTPQMWVILMLYGFGGSILLLGLVLMINQGYFFLFKDPGALIIILLMSVAYWAGRRLVLRCLSRCYAKRRERAQQVTSNGNANGRQFV